MRLTDAQRATLAAEIVARRERTRARLAQLDRDVAALVDATHDSPDDEHDPEGTTIGFERAQASTLRDDAVAALAALDRAADALQAGTIGTCRACGGPVAFERLLARPATDRCVGCAA